MESFDDDRFAAVAKDPRFRQVPKQERKVKIDKRFQGMFTDKRFKLKYSVDKRGRPENQSSGENLKKFYELEDSDKEGEHEGEGSVAQGSISKETKTGTSNSKGKLKNARRLSGKELLLEYRKRKVQSRDPARTASNNVSSSNMKHKESVKFASQGATHPGRRSRKTAVDVEYAYSSESDSDEESGLGSDGSDNVELGRRGTKAQLQSDSESESDDKQTGPSWRKQVGIDLARGEGNMETSSSESDSGDDLGQAGPSTGYAKKVIPLTDELSHQWGELDADAPREVNTSKRLAICNMDWDSVTASDLLILLNSFKPTGGVLHSIKIYPSEFGLERMSEEDAKGPQELLERNEKEKRLEKFQQEKYHMEKLRKYQLQRLKYYYAVLECDSAETANTIYEQCDGMEYETSAAKLDLRFVPDDTVFEHEPRDVATELPDTTSYKPMEFETTALTQAKVQLTWDEMDKRRAKKTLEAFRSKNVEEMENHMQAYLASSSSSEGSDDEEDEEEGSSEEEEEGASKNPRREKERIDKYRSLLQGIEQKEKQEKEDKEMEMEISWEPGLKETTQEIVKKRSEGTGSTPWEKYLEKKKEKKKERKEEKKKTKEKPRVEESSEGEQAFSDDDLPEDIDLNDPFFKDSLKDVGRKDIKGKDKRKPVDKKTEEVEEEKQRKAALELLMLDEDDDGKRHFNLKGIIESENMSKSKRKRQLKQQRKLGQTEDAPSAPVQDNFEIDTTDPRFEAMFESHEYAIDPSAPQFKKTKAMSKLLTERQKRRQETGGEDNVPVTKAKKKNSAANAELSQLVKSIKNKTEQFHSRKKLKVDK